MPFRSPCRPSQSPSVTALPEGEPSRARCPQRAAVAGIRIAAERKRNVRSADPTVDVGPTSALRPPRNDMTRRLSGRGTAGKSPKRRLWRMKRGDFEEVPRLSAATAAESRLARRWADNRRSAAPWLPPWGSCRRSRLRGEIAEQSDYAIQKPLQALSVTFGDSSPRGRAK